MPSISEGEFVKVKKELLRAKETIQELKKELGQRDSEIIELENVFIIIQYF